MSVRGLATVRVPGRHGVFIHLLCQEATRLTLLTRLIQTYTALYRRTIILNLLRDQSCHFYSPELRLCPEKTTEERKRERGSVSGLFLSLL